MRNLEICWNSKIVLMFHFRENVWQPFEKVLLAACNHKATLKYMCYPELLCLEFLVKQRLDRGKVRGSAVTTHSITCQSSRIRHAHITTVEIGDQKIFKSQTLLLNSGNMAAKYWLGIVICLTVVPENNCQVSYILQWNPVIPDGFLIGNVRKAGFQ